MPYLDLGRAESFCTAGISDMESGFVRDGKLLAR